MENIKKNRIVPVLLLAASAVLAVVSVFFTYLLLLLPGFIAANVAKSRKPVRAIIGVFLFPVIAMLVIYGANAEFLSTLPVALLGPAGGMLIYSLQKKKIRCFDTVFYTAILFGGLVYLSVTLPGLLSGGGAFALVKLAAESLTETMRNGYLSLPVSSGPFANNLYLTALNSLPELFVQLLVPSCAMIAGILALSNLLVFRLFIKKQRECLGFAPMRKFCDWSIPNPYIFGCFMVFIGSLILDIAECESAYPVSYFSFTITVFPFLLQGLCCIDWILTKRNPDKSKLLKKRILFYTLITVLLRFSFTALVLIGGFEMFVHMRKRVIVIHRPGGSGPRPPFWPRKHDSDNENDPPESDAGEDKPEDK